MKDTKKEYVLALGRRKSAVARVRLFEHVAEGMIWDQLPIKKGEIYVNGKTLQEYFTTPQSIIEATEPLRIANVVNKYTYTIRVVGGGLSGQLDAVVAGISNALAKLNPEEFRGTLKKKGFLTRDPRIRERRKAGTGGKARRAKQSPKR